MEPAAAQANVICSADNLRIIIGGLSQLTTTLGTVGFVDFLADSLIEISIGCPEQKKGLSVTSVQMKSAVVLGPSYTVVGSIMGLPLAQCVDPVSPW